MAELKYKKWVEQFGLEYIRRLAEENLSDSDMAIQAGIPLADFRLWQKKYPEFAEAVDIGRSGADFAVVKSLYKRALGYNVSLNKTYKLKRVDYDPDTGKKLREYEELATGVDETYVPADLRAATFWLKSRQPDRWGEHLKLTPEEERALGGIIEMPEADLIDECGEEE